MNAIIITVDERRSIDCRKSDGKDEAIGEIMMELFGEDWEIQMNDDDWELASEIRYAFDQLYEGDQYTDRDGITWKVALI